FYTTLLKLYPRSYREKYGQPMLDVLLDITEAEPSFFRKMHLEFRACLDLPGHIAEENTLALLYNWTHEISPSLRHGTIFAGFLLVPFWMIGTANFLTETSFSPLEHSFLWSEPVLITWGLAFPVLALFVIFFSLLSPASRRPSFHFRRIWPAFLTGAAAFSMLFFMVFHFGGSCFLHKPFNLNHAVGCFNYGLQKGDRDGQE
ncbi:MAG TPA: hypothetical protein VFM02_02815, partial [Candidatus Paceibacterota bacterium]|nr:hypothetical protein [Candidatus Paceibacterota bacterium]